MPGPKTKRCWRCTRRKRLIFFSTNRSKPDGLSSECRRCVHETDLARRQRDPLYDRRTHIKRYHGLTPGRYDQTLDSQGGVCKICGTDKPGGRSGKHFAIDHDHKTGKFRGLLCSNCNQVLGHAKDSPRVLRNALTYLESHAQPS